MNNIKKQQKQLSRKFGFRQKKPCFLRMFKKNNAISFAIAVLFVAFSFTSTACLASVDFLVGDSSGDVELFKNDGAGNFVSGGIITDVGNYAWGLTSADYDEDGDIDFLVGNVSGTGKVGLFKNNGDGSFTAEGVIANTYGNCACALTSADFNGNGHIDFIAGNHDGNVQYYANSGGANFTYSGAFIADVGDNAYGLTSADFDGDGHVDLLVGDFDGEVEFFKNNGDGTGSFTSAGIITDSGANGDAFGLVSWDYNEDGHIDFVVATAGNNLALFENDGAGNFSYIVDGMAVLGAQSFGLAAADFDEDGHVDLVEALGNGKVYVVNYDGTGGIIIPGGLNYIADVGDWAFGLTAADFTTPPMLSGWNSRCDINIDNTSASDLTDFQISFAIDTQAFITAGTMQSECQDIRVTDSDGTTVLPYWIKGGCNTTETTIWTKVPTILGSSNKTIYAYYDNVIAVSESKEWNDITHLGIYGGVFDYNTMSMMEGANDAIGMSAGGYHTCILKSDGNVDCYGKNDDGQSADYTGGDAIGVSAGKYYTCILKSDGNADCYGKNDDGQSADYTGGDAIGVYAGEDHTCILKSDGNVDCYGNNDFGQSADYTGGDAIGVSVGKFHTCILKSDGNVGCHGINWDGQSADYTGSDAIGISAEEHRTCILKSDGNVDCRGANWDGQSADYTGGDAIGISAGGFHTCILKSDGNTDCYGRTSEGQSEDYINGDAIGVSAGGFHTCILKPDGNADCYGESHYGQASDYTGGDAYNPFRKYANRATYPADEPTTSVNCPPIEEDTTPPTLVTEVWIPDDATGTEIVNGGIVDLEKIDEAGEFLTIYSNASDPVPSSGIQDHKITYWHSDSAGNPISSGTTTWFTGGLHSIIINGPLADGDVIEYQTEATDNAVPPNTAYDPADGVTKYSFTVREACVIDSIPDLIMTGGSDNYTFGASVSLDGDVNGDGYDDIIVAHGYSDATSANSDVEKAYIYFGGPLSDNIADVVLDNNNSSEDDTVSSGNVNGDAFDDVVVGNPGKNTAYIYFGGSPMDNIVDVTLTTGNNNGKSVDVTGDVNNDGFNDVIIEGSFDRAYLFYGGLSMDGTADLTFFGSDGFDVLRVSFAGDVNGDGYDDILIGNDNYDRAYLYYGGSPMDNVADITFTDSNFVDQERVSSAGDVNNDGFDDILLASPWEGIGVPNWVYLYYGSATMNSSYSNLEADLSFTNPNWVRFFDISYGNLNGDSYSDIIISDIEEKKAYIYYGGSAMDNIADVIINGPADLYWGWSTSLGNFDDSGFDEIVIGAQFANAGGVKRGQVSVYQCLPPGTPPTVTTNPPSVDYCGIDLPGGISLSWNFNDAEDGTTQTAYEIELTRNGTTPCASGKQISSATSLVGTDINSFAGCTDFIDYGGYTYTWRIKVYDSDDANSDFVPGDSFPPGPTPAHRYPIADFSYSADDDPPLQFQEISFDPSSSQTFGGSSIANWTWDFGDGSASVSIDNDDPPITDGKTTHFYSEEDSFTVDLQVTDSDGYACWASQNLPVNTEEIDIGINTPDWNETIP